MDLFCRSFNECPWCQNECARCDNCWKEPFPVSGNCNPDGTFVNIHTCRSTGATECVDCETGKTTERTGSTSSDLCVCAPGYYYTSWNTCSMCQSGSYSDVTNSNQCLICAAGTYASGKCTEGNVEYCTKKSDGSAAESCDDLVERHGPNFPYLKDVCCLCKWRRKMRAVFCFCVKCKKATCQCALDHRVESCLCLAPFRRPCVCFYLVRS
jgi:hypothetical protein